MLKYKLYQETRANSPKKGKWYARAVVNQTVDINGLAEHMALHNTPFSKGVIKGILTDMVSCVRELTLNGTAVKLENLAIFSLGIRTRAANSAKDFSAATNVNSVRLRARATGQFTPGELKNAASITEQDNYKVERV